MVQQMINEINLDELEWYEKNSLLEDKDLVLLNKIPFMLPPKFIELLKISDGGILKNRSFEYHDIYFQEIMETSVSVIHSICHDDYDNLISDYFNPPEMFPKNIVIFGANGGGDYICFDYRNDQNTNNPPVIYYHHGLPIENCLSFIANNFEEFLAMLKKFEDD